MLLMAFVFDLASVAIYATTLNLLVEYMTGVEPDWPFGYLVVLMNLASAFAAQGGRSAGQYINHESGPTIGFSVAQLVASMAMILAIMVLMR